MIFLERMREGHHQSNKHWNHFKGNIGETSEMRWNAHGLFQVHRYHLELNFLLLPLLLYIYKFTFTQHSVFFTPIKKKIHMKVKSVKQFYKSRSCQTVLLFSSHNTLLFLAVQK